MSYGLFQSVDKLFSYYSAVSKEDITIDVSGKTTVYKAPKEIRISKNLFRSYSCLKYPECSLCCTKVGFWNIFTEPEAVAVWKPTADGIYINGKLKLFRFENHESTDCQHLNRQKNSCKLYGREPLHCMFPLVKFKRKGDIVVLTKEQFGRNWKFGCPVEFEFPCSTADMEKLDYQLGRLEDAMKFIGIENHCHSLRHRIVLAQRELSVKGV